MIYYDYFLLVILARPRSYHRSYRSYSVPFVFRPRSYSRSYSRVPEDLVPLAEASIRGQDKGALFVAAGNPRTSLLNDQELVAFLPFPPYFPPMGIGIEAIISHHDLLFVGNVRGHPGDEASKFLPIPPLWIKIRRPADVL